MLVSGTARAGRTGREGRGCPYLMAGLAAFTGARVIRTRPVTWSSLSSRVVFRGMRTPCSTSLCTSCWTIESWAASTVSIGDLGIATPGSSPPKRRRSAADRDSHLERERFCVCQVGSSNSSWRGALWYGRRWGRGVVVVVWAATELLWGRGRGTERGWVERGIGVGVLKGLEIGKH